MEQLEKYKNLPEEQENLLEDAKITMAEVLSRIEQTSKKYGTAYTLADVEAELAAELLDVVGWPLLQVIRLRQVMKGRLATLNGAYLEKFLVYHDSKYLKYLRDAIDGELSKRGTVGDL